jgi:hypothetical protein
MHMKPQIAVIGMAAAILLQAQSASDDIRENFEATFYTGASIDTFAAQDLNSYLNPNESGKIKTGYIAGVDFAYRALGTPDSRKPQLWIYGETVHGKRSSDVDCSGTQKPEVCTLAGFTPSNQQAQFLYILRNADSLEAFAGLRLEFLTLQRGSGAAAKLYAKTELGFFDVSGSGADVVIRISESLSAWSPPAGSLRAATWKPGMERRICIAFTRAAALKSTDILPGILTSG